MNTAARLQARRPADGRRRRRAHAQASPPAAFAYEELGAAHPQGQVGTGEGVARRGAARRAGRRRGASTATPMVGRERELATCLQAVERLRDGAGGLLLITGEAGIGKTRLVDGASGASPAAQGCAWLEGHTLSFGRSHQLLAVPRDRAAGRRHRERRPRGRARGQARCARDRRSSASRRRRSCPTWPPCSACQCPTSSPRGSGTWTARPWAGSSTAPRVSTSRASPRRRPLVVTFEDVHWMDASSAALLEHLLPLVDEVRSCSAASRGPSSTARSPTCRNWRGPTTPPARRRSRCTPLSAAESTTLVQQLARIDELPAALRDAILAKAQGNPFFVEEIVRSLIDLGGLERDRRDRRLQRHRERGDRISHPGHPPRGDHGARRPPRRRPQAGAAAGLGHRAHLLLPAPGRDRRGGARTRREPRRAAGARAGAREAHATPSSSTCSSTPWSRRRPTRASCCSAAGSCTGGWPPPSRASSPDRLEEFSGLLAYHYSKAEDWEKAQEYLLQGRRPGGEHRRRRRGAGPLPGGDRRLRPRLRRHVGPAGAGGAGAQDGRGPLPPRRAGAGRRVPLPGARDAGQSLSRHRPARMRRAIVVQLVRQVGHRLFPWFRPPADAG